MKSDTCGQNKTDVMEDGGFGYMEEKVDRKLEIFKKKTNTHKDLKIRLDFIHGDKRKI